MPVPADIAKEKLRIGNDRYVRGVARTHFTATERAAATEGQQPLAAVVGCSDSRVPVEAIFDAGMGELFVVRSAGHVISEAGYVSLRFAAEKLGVRLVVVLGHEDCGAVSAALKGDPPYWLTPITDHIRVCASNPVDAVDAHAIESAGEIAEWFQREAPELGVTVAPAAYQLSTGEVRWL